VHGIIVEVGRDGKARDVLDGLRNKMRAIY
jgi:hypothetical protein